MPYVHTFSNIFSHRTLYGRAYATVLRLSVCRRRLYGMYCG